MLSFSVGLNGTNGLNLIPLISLAVEHEQNSKAVPGLKSSVSSAPVRNQEISWTVPVGMGMMDFSELSSASWAAAALGLGRQGVNLAAGLGRGQGSGTSDTAPGSSCRPLLVPLLPLSA